VRNLVFKILVNAVALWVAAWAVSGVHFGDPGEAWTKKAVTVVLVALVFGVVNALIKPVVKFLSFPAVVLTLGLFTFVVNAFMLQITEWIAKPLGLAFSIDHFFWDAVIAAIVVTLVSWALNVVLPDDDD
jgi:putative membrane protein